MGLFPDSMLNKSSPLEMTMEDVASKFDYFFQQIHLLHLQTSSYAEHKALQVWDTIPDVKDEFLEKLMGYEGRKLRVYKPLPIADYSMDMPKKIITDLKDFAEQLESYAGIKNYSDIENLAQSLSGTASQTLYLLTLS
jgi:Family of unknown function (DUF5856)